VGWFSAFSSVLDYLFPPYCLLCESRDIYQGGCFICRSCVDSISFITHPLCSRCGKPFLTQSDRDHLCGNCLTHNSYFTTVRALGTYEGSLGKIVHLLKYKQKFAIEEVLTLLLDICQHIDINFCSYDFFVPVPLHRSRLRQRGFNQAVVLGNVLRKKHTMPLQRLTLQRTVATPPQVRLRGKERMKNMRNAFKVKDAALVQNKSILLLDDVYTTGATMNECARVLKKAGALRVDGFVIARAV